MEQKYQGDVSIIKLDKEPKVSFAPLASEGLVVAEGEVTGHNHRLQVKDHSAVIGFAQDQNGFYIKVEGGNAVLTHQEHQTVELEPAIYFIGRQWEFDEIAERRVRD